MDTTRTFGGEFSERLREGAAACAATETVTSRVAATDCSPAQASRKLFPKQSAIKRGFGRFRLKRDLYDGHREPTREDLDVAAGAGKWSTRPSDLFLKIFADVLLCLSRDPLSGVVSPPLIGTEGVIPLSIVSVIPTIMQHYYDAIVTAQDQVILLTNYWQSSDSSRKIREALLELDRRSRERGHTVIVKLMLDRGTPEQLYNQHAPVAPGKMWTSLDIPLPREVPNLSMQLINLYVERQHRTTLNMLSHRPLLGTFHVKMLVVDQKLALLNSNNIQDRPNLEMMTHLEGPIVLSLLDTALLSWHNALSPLLPRLKQPITPFDPSASFRDNPALIGIDLSKAATHARKMLLMQHSALAERIRSTHPAAGAAFQRLVYRAVDDYHTRQFRKATADSKSVNSKRRASTVNTTAADKSARPSMDGCDQLAVPPKLTITTASNGDSAMMQASPIAMTLSNTSDKLRISEAHPNGVMNGSPIAHVVSASPEMSRQVSASSSLDRPNSAPPRASVDDGFATRMDELSHTLNAGVLRAANTTLQRDGQNEQFAPHRLHRPHAPFPMAVVNRKPHGLPGHNDIRVPQDAAWLCVEESIFVQTPTFNAKPAVHACLEACRRGVHVTIWSDYGFNDKSEAWPFQGGTNATVFRRMATILQAEGKRDFLHLYWYVGRDQLRPLNAVHKSRNCHIKFLSVDGYIAMMGVRVRTPFVQRLHRDRQNANHDTQSWCHSQEVNILIDSEQIVGDWMAQLHSNQNTHLYGLCDPDGVWRDSDGRQIDDIELPPKPSASPPTSPPVPDLRAKSL